MRRQSGYKYFGVFGLILCWVMQSCSHKGAPASGLELADSLFVLRDIKSSLVSKQFFYDEKGLLYVDSTEKQPFKKLDFFQRSKLVVFATGFDSAYVVSSMNAFFISKQQKIGSYTPIILSVDADDYSALVYELLDESNNPVARYILHGGECAGPEYDDGTTLEYCPEKESSINNDIISSYVLHIYIREDSTLAPARIDSISYNSKVLPKGIIETRQTDSVSYRRMTRDGEFRDL